MKNKIIFNFSFIIAMLFFISCNDNDLNLLDKDEILTPDMSKSMSSGILQTSYEITTWTEYEIPKKELSDLARIIHKKFAK